MGEAMSCDDGGAACAMQQTQFSGRCTSCEDLSAHATQFSQFHRQLDATEAEVPVCGECSMKSFIRANFISILKPFADHVGDLQSTVTKLNAKQGQHSETL